MALLVSACKHDARRQFRGMRRVGFVDEDTALYRCAICLAELTAPRCTARVKDGRCWGVSLEDLDLCRKHSVASLRAR